MLPSPNDVSELDSVEVTEPQETQTHISGFNVVAFLKRNAFVVFTMVGVALGIGLGIGLRHTDMSARGIKYLSFPGEMMLRILQMLVLPLTISTLITGMSSLDRTALGKIGLRAISYYIITTLIAIFTGVVLAVLIRPGKSSLTDSVSSSGNAETVQTVDSFLDLIRNLIPSNLVEACFRKYRTVYSSSVSTGESLGVVNITESSENNDKVPQPGILNGVNTVGLLVFSVAFGLTLSSMGADGKPLRDFFDCLNTAIMHLIRIVIWYAPVGTLFLLAGQVVKMADIGETGRKVLMYALTVISGLLIHSFFTFPLIYFVVTRKNPYRFMSGLLKALTTAFGTASSSATLPVTLHCMEENLCMDKRVTRFMLPIGATMNMDGSALYETVAALFIAQNNNMDFNFAQIIVLSLIVTVVSTGASAMPQAGMVSMTLVLSSAGLPIEDISLLLIFDWILDRLRTATNVLGDCIGVGVVQHLSKRELQSYQICAL